jgi:hypothetical protein
VPFGSTFEEAVVLDGYLLKQMSSAIIEGEVTFSRNISFNLLFKILVIKFHFYSVFNYLYQRVVFRVFNKSRMYVSHAINCSHRNINVVRIR